MMMLHTAADQSSSSSTAKEVRFSEEVGTAIRQDCRSSTHEEIQARWYSPKDLQDFKDEFRQVVVSQRLGQQQPRHRSCCEESSVRGLEKWKDVEGFKHRLTMTIRCLLQAQKEGISQEKIAEISQNLSAWSQEVAMIQGLHDYCDAYKPSMSSLVPKVQRTPPKFPVLKSKRARRGSCSDGASSNSERRVRPRIDCAI